MTFTWLIRYVKQTSEQITSRLASVETKEFDIPIGVQPGEFVSSLFDGNALVIDANIIWLKANVA